MDISNKWAALVAILINLGGLAFEKLGIEVAALPLLIFSVFGIIFVFIKNCLDSKDKKISIAPNNKRTIQSIIDNTYSLYNDTGLFVKYCYLEEQGNRLLKLNDSFDSYLKNIKGKLVLVPQVLELKILRFFDILFDYKRSGEIIFSATKTNNRYTDQQELEKKFTNEVSPLYTEIEVDLRKILNNPTQPVA